LVHGVLLNIIQKHLAIFGKKFMMYQSFESPLYQWS